MPWFRRRRGKAARLKEGPAATVPGTVAETPATDALLRGPSHRTARRRRSSASMRDVEKNYHPQSSTEDISALPRPHQLNHSPHLRPITQSNAAQLYNLRPQSHASLPPSAKERGKLQRPQSLRRVPPTESLIRRKSSKKRKELDHAREEEIRAMSLAMPQKRPAANSGGMLRRDSKKVKGGFNHRFDRPTSNVSLPLEDSVHSSMSGNSELRAFRVSTLDMFSPRPTIRCSLGSQYYGERTSPNTYSEKTDSRRERRPISSREEMRSKRSSRIDELADSLDAGELRDIMDRDKRRREKKAKAENERLRRRLERRAEKQNAAEVGGTPATPRREAVGLVGLGIGKDVSSPMEGVRPSTPPQPQWVEVLPTTPRSQVNNQLPTPLDSPVEEPIVSDARAVRYSRGSVSAQVHTRGPSNVSMLPDLLSERLAQHEPDSSTEPTHDPTRSGSLHPIDTVDTAITSRRSSIMRRRSSEGKRMGVFASLFRRGKRSSQDQGRLTPSEVSFSNTSRESMSRQPLPAHLVGTAPTTAPIHIKRPSSVPRRTMSKFREDLPEFPLSPPDSRVQSPEVRTTSSIATRRRSQAPSDIRVQSVSALASARSDSPVSPGVPVGNIMSQSLASVDSEASWLSGKPPKRASNRSQVRSSVTSSALPRNEEFNASYEELGMADDEYFKRLTPQTDEHRRSAQYNDAIGRKASSTLMALDAAVESEEEMEPTLTKKISGAEEELVKSGVARQPTIIHRRARVKSTEGLLSMFVDDKTPLANPFSNSKAIDIGPDPDSPVSDADSPVEPVMLQRAQSVELGKHHARHLSAGSAKLLEIQKRSSVSSHNRLSEQQ